MSLSINSAASALATLQTLSLQDAAGASAASSPSAPSPSPPPQDAVQPGGATVSYLVADAGAQALSAADAAGAAGQTVLGLLRQMQDAAGQASRPDLPAGDRAGLADAYNTASSRIGPALAGAGVGGVNLLDGTMSSGLKAPLGGGATASLTPADLTLGGSLLGAPPGIATATAAASSFDSLGEAIGAASGALATLQGQADQLQAHAGFVQQLGAALSSLSGGGGDGGADSVRLLALQVSQQLAAQPAAVANASPPSVLALFRS